MSRMKKKDKDRLTVSVRSEHRQSRNVKVRERKRWRVLVRDYHRVSGCRGAWGGHGWLQLNQTGGEGHENE